MGRLTAVHKVGIGFFLLFGGVVAFGLLVGGGDDDEPSPQGGSRSAPSRSACAELERKEITILETCVKALKRARISACEEEWETCR